MHSPRWVAAMLCLLLPGRALAGNDDTYFMSSRAALVGGAVAATAGDAGAVWYNPAGLGTIERQELNLQLTVGAWQGRQIDSGLVGTVEGRSLSTDLDGNRTTIVSPSTVYVRRFGRVVVGGGIFVSRDDVSDVFGTTEQQRADLAGFSSLAIATAETRYHLGLATGFPLGTRVRLGFGAFGIYDGFDTNTDFSMKAQYGSGDDAVLLVLQGNDRDRTTRWACEITAGLQVDALPGLTIALMAHSPILLLRENYDQQTVISFGSNFGGDLLFDDMPRARAAPGPMEPARLALSVYYERGPFGLYAEGDWAHSLRSQRLTPADEDPIYLVDRKPLWNVRAGVHWDAMDNLRVGGGFFSDRSAKRESQSPTDFVVDYYGVTLGGILTQRVQLGATERSDDLLFKTSLSLRYAIGVGETAQLRVDPGEFEIDIDNTVDVRFHELYVMVGSGLLF